MSATTTTAADELHELLAGSEAEVLTVPRATLIGALELLVAARQDAITAQHDALAARALALNAAESRRASEEALAQITSKVRALSALASR